MGIDWRLMTDLAQFLVMLVMGAWLRRAQRDQVTQAQIQAIDARLSRAEARIEQMPDHDDLGDLHDRVNQVKAGMDTMTGELTGIRTTLNLIHNYLLTGGKT